MSRTARLQQAMADCRTVAEGPQSMKGPPPPDSEADQPGPREVARARMYKLQLDCEVLEERLTLDMAMQYMMARLPVCCISMTSFLVALFILHPVAAITSAHQHIITHYGMDDEILTGVVDAEGIYDFVLEFESRNSELQGTSWKYWCEDRYFEHYWDDEFQVPTKACKSPRLFSLALIGDEESRWSTWRQTHEMDERSTNCTDLDMYLMGVTGYPFTCAQSAPGVCENSLGVKFCQHTCGYCPIFVYTRYHKFKASQLSILPTIVHQVRQDTKECTDFSAYYNSQQPNPHMSYLPALDGTRDGQALFCTDPDKIRDDEYAMNIECDPDMYSMYCADGNVAYSAKSQYKGTVIYPRMIAESVRDVETMRLTGWIDGQTSSVSVSSIIYTSEADLYTSVVVDFVFDSSGKVDISRQIKSIPDLHGTRASRFVGTLLVAIAAQLTAAILAVRGMYLDTVFSRFFHAVEVFATLCLLLFAAGLVVIFFLLPDIQEIVLGLSLGFLTVNAQDEASFREAIDTYFATKADFARDVQWLNTLNLAACLVLYVQFLLALVYTGLHPRVGNVILVVMFAGDHLLHLMLVFFCLFMFLAAISCWTLGSEVYDLRYVSTTIATQFRLLFGEDLDGEIFRHFEPSTMVMFQVYYLSFLFFMFFMLVNLFVAIMVDALAKVRRVDTHKMSDRNFLVDIWDACYSLVLYRYYGWPPIRDMLKLFDNDDEDDEPEVEEDDDQGDYDGPSKPLKAAATTHLRPVESAAEFYRAVTGDFNNFPRFLLYYLGKCGAILADVEEQQDGTTSARVTVRASAHQGSLLTTMETPSVAELKGALVILKEESTRAKAQYKESIAMLRKERAQAEEIRRQIWMERQELRAIYNLFPDATQPEAEPQITSPQRSPRSGQDDVPEVPVLFDTTPCLVSRNERPRGEIPLSRSADSRRPAPALRSAPSSRNLPPVPVAQPGDLARQRTRPGFGHRWLSRRVDGTDQE